jgi:Ca2+-transporting ATPase
MKKEYFWHSLHADQALEQLESNQEKGLTKEIVHERLIHYGPNSLPAPLKKSFFAFFFHQFLSPLIYLLLGTATVSFFIGEASDALVILGVVFLNALIGAFQEGRAEQSLIALRKLSKLNARVLRESGEIQIEASELVPGDILILSAGDAVLADARVIEATTLSTSEAALTGESASLLKSVDTLPEETIVADRHNMVFAGTYITAGHGKGLVVATGMTSEIGKIAKLAISVVQPKTQLELRIHQFGKQLIVIALFVFILVVAMGLVRGILFSQIFMIAISQMVSLVPEGLPVAMTVALAAGVRRMAKRGTIVRRLAAVETLGTTTVICTDKTGTLTRNEMTVTSVYLPGGKREISVSGVGYSPVGSFFENNLKIDLENDLSLEKLFESCCLCNDSQLLNPDSSTTEWRILGDPTEGALHSLAAKGGRDPNILRNEFPRLAEIPFNSHHKMMATQHLYFDKNIVFIKGAPEELLKLCGQFDLDGNQVPMNQQTTDLIHLAAKKMADSALRVLALGYVDDSVINGAYGFDQFLGKVTFLGMVGELDPPRSEVAESIRQCQRAKIRVVMITGDHVGTAQAIAQSLGINQNADQVIDGVDLDQLSDLELSKKVHYLNVFARVHPAQKLRIVDAFQKNGDIVAMTGDGVNDAPAIIKANVGVAMGITGTDVAKEAAKIVITDDNFATIVAAIAEGRLVWQNIKKLILFLFVTSIDEVIILFLALLFGFSPPFLAVQILWINLVAEGTLTVNLVMEPLEGNEMDYPPVPKNHAILDRNLLSRIPLMVIATVISTFGWFVYRTNLGVHPQLVQSETFTAIVFCQWLNVLNCRYTNRSVFSWEIFKNPWLVGGLIVSVILQTLVIYWHDLGQFFHTVPIAPLQLLEIGIVSSLVLWTEEIRKVIVRKYFKKKFLSS